MFSSPEGEQHRIAATNWTMNYVRGELIARCPLKRQRDSCDTYSNSKSYLADPTDTNPELARWDQREVHAAVICSGFLFDRLPGSSDCVFESAEGYHCSGLAMSVSAVTAVVAAQLLQAARV